MLQLADKVLFSVDEIRDEFYRWLNEEPTTLSYTVMQGALAEMEDTLSEEICREHGFAIGCSVGHAARSLIVLTRSDGEEYRLNSLINFHSERESLDWWRRNRDNPRRVVLEPNGDGRWSLGVAG